MAKKAKLEEDDITAEIKAVEAEINNEAPAKAAETKEAPVADEVTDNDIEDDSDANETPEDSVETDTDDKTDNLKKAGKHSAKAIREAEAEAERKAKAADKAEHEPKPRVTHKPNPLKAHGKKYRELVKLIEADKQYDLKEAIELAQKTSPVKFDASVELHVNLGVDPRQADQMVRASVVLPAGTGKSLRVAVLTNDTDKQAEAKAAGADVVGDDDLIKQIEKGDINFDVLIATPQVMSKLGKLAKVLGPKGLMPNPKSGTVTANVAEAVKASKGGRVEFRIDKQSIIHQAIGKVRFKAADLETNALTLVNAIMTAKPTAAKGSYVKRMSLATTMGPGIKLNHTSVIAAANQAK